MRAGRAKIDITPAAGTPMDGYYVRSEPSIGVHDPLYCRAVVLDDGSKTLAIASCDLCWVTYPVVTEVRRQAALVGIDHVFISATHSHSGPAIADFLAAQKIAAPAGPGGIEAAKLGVVRVICVRK